MKRIMTAAAELVQLGDQFISAQGFGQFATEAHRLLAATDMAALFDYQQLVEASFADNFKQLQNFGSFEFSDLPLTLARGKHCFIDIYFWRRRPTVIHNHHFTGAFQCLLGTNVDSEFIFEKKKQLGEFHALGELTLKHTREIKQGDIAPIALLDNFIHQNHHQAELTVNLCFRTPEIGQHSLANYLYSGLRYEKSPELLARTHRLWKFIQLDDFDFRRINLSLDDALYFLLQVYGEPLGNLRLTRLVEFLEQKVQQEAGISIAELMQDHDKILDEIQSRYE